MPDEEELLLRAKVGYPATRCTVKWLKTLSATTLMAWKLPKKVQTKLDLSVDRVKFLKLVKLIQSRSLIQMHRMGRCLAQEESETIMVPKEIKIIHSRITLSPRYMEKAINLYSLLTKVVPVLPSVTRCITT